MNAYQNPAATARQQAPYEQSRGSLRAQFGARKIDASAPAAPRDLTGARLAPADPNTGFTDENKWNTFFKFSGSEPRPPTPSQMGGVAGGITAPGNPTGNVLGSATPASNTFRQRFGRKPPASTEPTTPWSAAPTGPFAPTGYERPTTRPAHGAAPSEFINAAFSDTTSYWNKLGVPIPTPPAGAVQAGTSFRSRFGTGRVDSAAALAVAPMNNANEGMRRLMKARAPRVQAIWGE